MKMMKLRLMIKLSVSAMVAFCQILARLDHLRNGQLRVHGIKKIVRERTNE